MALGFLAQLDETHVTNGNRLQATTHSLAPLLTFSEQTNVQTSEDVKHPGSTAKSSHPESSRTIFSARLPLGGGFRAFPTPRDVDSTATAKPIALIAEFSAVKRVSVLGGAAKAFRPNSDAKKS